MKCKINTRIILLLSLAFFCLLGTITTTLSVTDVHSAAAASENFLYFDSTNELQYGSIADGELTILGCGSMTNADNCATNNGDPFYLTQQNGNTITFTDSTPPVQTITVSNICSPGSASLTVSGKTSTISVGGFSSASGGNNTWCSQGVAPTSQNITATVTFNNFKLSDVSNNNVVGPVTFVLYQGLKSVTSVQSSNPSTVAIGSNNGTSLTGVFNNVTPGNYSVCIQGSSPLVCNSSSNAITTSSFTGPISVQITDSQSSIESLVSAAPSSSTQPSCDSSSFSMSWAICPLVDGIQWIANKAESAIDSELTVPVDNYFNNSCTTSGVDASGCNTTNTNYKIWSNMRDVALSLLVIVALIMVIATALDVGPFDAYTVKKVLPRIVIAVIAISLSWQIGRFLVQLSDDLGAGVSNLIYSAAGVDQHMVLAGIGSGIFAWLGAGAVVGVATVTILLGQVAPIGLLLLLLPLILGLGIAFLTLILRRMIIVICVVFAPIAFVAFILPGTQKVWKLWKDSFFGALFVFPMITGVIAIGSVLAYMTNNGDSSGGFITPLIALTFYVLPFFLIPKLVKMSSGALGLVSNTLGNMSKGGYAALKKSRQNQWAQRREKSKAGGLYGVKRFGKNKGQQKFLSKVGVGIGTGAKGHFGVGETGYRARNNAIQSFADEKLRDPKFVNQMYNDGVRKALQYGSAANARAHGISESDIKAADVLGFNAQTQMAAFKSEASNKARNFGSIHEANEMIRDAARMTGTDETELRETMSFGMRQQGIAMFGSLDGSDLRATTREERFKAEAAQAVAGDRRVTLYDQATRGPGRSTKTISDAYRYLATNNDQTEAERAENMKKLAVHDLELETIQKNATGEVASQANEDRASQRDLVDGYLSPTVTTTDRTGAQVVVEKPGAIKVPKMVQVTEDDGTGRLITRNVIDPDQNNWTTTTTQQQEVTREARAYGSGVDPNIEEATRAARAGGGPGAPGAPGAPGTPGAPTP